MSETRNTGANRGKQRNFVASTYRASNRLAGKITEYGLLPPSTRKPVGAAKNDTGAAPSKLPRLPGSFGRSRDEGSILHSSPGDAQELSEEARSAQDAPSHRRMGSFSYQEGPASDPGSRSLYQSAGEYSLPLYNRDRSPSVPMSGSSKPTGANTSAKTNYQPILPTELLGTSQTHRPQAHEPPRVPPLHLRRDVPHGETIARDLPVPRPVSPGAKSFSTEPKLDNSSSFPSKDKQLTVLVTRDF